MKREVVDESFLEPDLGAEQKTKKKNMVCGELWSLLGKGGGGLMGDPTT